MAFAASAMLLFSRHDLWGHATLLFRNYVFWGRTTSLLCHPHFMGFCHIVGLLACLLGPHNIAILSPRLLVPGTLCLLLCLSWSRDIAVADMATWHCCFVAMASSGPCGIVACCHDLVSPCDIVVC